MMAEHRAGSLATDVIGQAGAKIRKLKRALALSLVTNIMLAAVILMETLRK